MAGFIEEVDRGQQSLLPGSLDDWVHKDNPVRVIDAFVEALNLHDLGFETVDPIGIGRPGYHPSVHLKLYIYGFSNGPGVVKRSRCSRLPVQHVSTIICDLPPILLGVNWGCGSSLYGLAAELLASLRGQPLTELGAPT